MNRYRKLFQGSGQTFNSAVFILLLLCLAAAAWTSARAPRQTLTVATADSFDEIDPSQATSLNSRRSLYCVYETLVRPGGRPGEVIPWLAESWQCDAQQRVWIFNLRRGVCFHDGTEFNADTLVEALRRSWGTEGMYSGSFAHHRALLGERGRPLLQKAEAVGPFAVRIELRKPIADFLEILAQPALAVTIVRMSRPGGHPVLWGTGPYLIEERRPRQRLVLRRFSRYWHHLPTWKKIVFWHVGKADWRRRQIERGHADLALTIDRRSLSELRQQKRVRLLAHPGRAYWSLMLNCSRIPFQDIRCRLGLQYAFDKNRLVQKFLGEYGDVAEACLPGSSWAYPGDLGTYAYDPLKARSWFLKVYGKDIYRDIERVELLYEENAPLDDECRLLAGDLVQAMNEAGLNAHALGVSREDYLRRLATGAFQVALVMNEHSLSDPDVELSMQWSESDGINGLVNISNYSSERLIQSLNEARSVPTREGRRRAYFRAMHLLQEGAAEVPLAWTLVVSAYDADIRGLAINRLNMIDLSEAAYSI